MNEFKGTKEIVIDQGSVFKPLSGYVSVNLTNSEGWPVATVFAPDFEKLKADSLMFQKAPEMLEMLKDVYLQMDAVGRRMSDENDSKQGLIGRAAKIKQLIKEATELK